MKPQPGKKRAKKPPKPKDDGLPVWFGKEREQRNRRSREQERKHAKQEKGRVQPGSGSSWRAPQDVRTGAYLDQCKFTDKESFTIKASEWEALRGDALRAGREPRFVIEFPRRNLKLYITEG